MIPVDGSQASNFEGIDYTAYFRGAEVYDVEAATGRVLELVGDFLKEKGLMSRRCFPGGIGATSGPEFFEVIRWIHEHMEYLAGLATVWLARVAKVRNKWRQLRGRIDERVLDPYKPSCVVELGIRAKGDGVDSREKAAQSFKSALVYVPEIDALLRRKLPDHSFTIRVLTCGDSPVFAYAYFKVPVVKRSDVAKMIRFLEKRKNQDGLSAVLLYRRFGFITRLQASEGGREFMRLTMR